MTCAWHCGALGRVLCVTGMRLHGNLISKTVDNEDSFIILVACQGGPASHRYGSFQDLAFSVHLCMCLCFCVSAYHVCAGIHGGQQRVGDPWSWSYRWLWADWQPTSGSV